MGSLIAVPIISRGCVKLSTAGVNLVENDVIKLVR
jgi:hypothetical protein